MRVVLPYGRGDITCEFNNIDWKTLESGFHSKNPSESVIESAVNCCLDAVKHRRIKNILLVVPDHTRKCSLTQILPRLCRKLTDIAHVNIEILVANGSHVKQQASVIQSLVSDEVFDRFPVEQHDCQDTQNLIKVGDTDRETPIYLNQKVVRAELVITLGGVLYHYFAGFGGGPKMILPGTAGYETIRRNHQLTIDREKRAFHQGCREGNLDTNPVFLDLKQIVKFVPDWISLQWLVSPEGGIVDAMCGPVLDVHRQICKKVEHFYTIPIEKKSRYCCGVCRR
mgnify:FL=1